MLVPRGFCHQCELEVLPRAVDNEGNFECPRCGESCVECPFESWERWSGVWAVQLSSGLSFELSVNSTGGGTVARRSDGGGPYAGHLVWAPLEHEGFLMRLDSNYLRATGLSIHLGPQPGGGDGLAVRQGNRRGNAVLGGAQRRVHIDDFLPFHAPIGMVGPGGHVVAYPANFAPPPQAASFFVPVPLGGVMEAMNGSLTVAGADEAMLPGDAAAAPAVGGAGWAAAAAGEEAGGGGHTEPGAGPAGGVQFRQALDQGLDQLAAHWPGLAGADRAEIRRQLQQFTAPLLGALAQGPVMLQAGAPRGPGQAPPGGLPGLPPGGAGSPGFTFLPFLAPDRAGHGVAFMPVQPMADFQQLFSWPPGGAFMPWGGFAGPTAPQQRGATEAAISAWLDTRAVDAAAAAKELESDWQCPICFDTSSEELVAVCKDDHGRTVHAFHKHCVAGWLVRRDECPSCRRTPVVEAPAATPAASLASQWAVPGFAGSAA